MRDPFRHPSNLPAHSKDTTSRREPEFSVLVVDPEPALFDAVVESIGNRTLLFQAGNLAEARKVLAAQRIDLALIDPELPDGPGLALAGEIRTLPRGGAMQVILLSHQPTVQQALEAIRLGVADFILKPINPADLGARVQQVVSRTRSSRRITRRLGRLRRICKKLNAARQQVTQQVDILCNDLVTAYQELAGQMQQISQTSEYAAVVDHELDLEQLLRKTLEYLLQKAGPTNAAIFLPSNEDDYTVGAYVNYDTTADAAQVLLQHLADVLAPRIAERDRPVHVTDDQTLQQWIGDDQAYLADAHVLAFAARLENEPLAVVALFRDGAEPFADALVEACAAVGPMLAEHLNKIIRIHHRHLPDPFESDDEQTDDDDQHYDQAA